MTEDEVRAAAERLVQFHERFAPLFGKVQAQDHAFTYVKGLMVCPDRKGIEPIALCVGDGQVSLGDTRSSSISPPGVTTTMQAGDPGRLRRRTGPHRRPEPDRRRRGGRREWLRQEGRAQRRRGPATQRPVGQGGQLPGRHVFLVGVTPGGSAAVGSSTLPTCPRVGARETRPGLRPVPDRGEGPHPRDGGLPDQARDRRGLDPAGAQQPEPCPWIGSRPTRSTARTAGSSTRWKGWPCGTSSRSRDDDDGLGRGPGVVCPASTTTNPISVSRERTSGRSSRWRKAATGGRSQRSAGIARS